MLCGAEVTESSTNKQHHHLCLTRSTPVSRYQSCVSCARSQMGDMWATPPLAPTVANGRHVGDPPPRAHMAPISARAHTTQRAAAQRDHPPPWASSPGRFRVSLASPGDGSDASVVFRRFHCRHFEPMAALLARNPLRIHPETFHFPY
jgi:hypothetical protein